MQAGKAFQHRVLTVSQNILNSLLLHHYHQNTISQAVTLSDPAAIYQQWNAASLSRTEPGLGVLVTKGEQGCAYWLAGHQGEVPAFAVNSVDTTGAGDSFVAGFLHQLCERTATGPSDPLQARQIVEYASAVGALTTMKPGAIAAQPTDAEVAVFLAKHSP
jgi:sugar/nucleoside kinase (ribokinase family)